jgi:hypothetical protein
MNQVVVADMRIVHGIVESGQRCGAVAAADGQIDLHVRLAPF